MVLAGEAEPDLIFDPESPEELQEAARADLVNRLSRIHLVIFGRERKARREISRHHRLLTGAGKQQPMPDPL